MKPDRMFPPIGLLIETLVAECPICDEAVIAHRFLGVGEARGMRWFVFYPHRAPCGLRCVAGGLFNRSGAKVHRGPGSCELCRSGHEDAPDCDLVLIDEAGTLENPDLIVVFDDDDDDCEALP